MVYMLTRGAYWDMSDCTLTGRYWTIWWKISQLPRNRPSWDLRSKIREPHDTTVCHMCCFCSYFVGLNHHRFSQSWELHLGWGNTTWMVPKFVPNTRCRSYVRPWFLGGGCYEADGTYIMIQKKMPCEWTQLDPTFYASLASQGRIAIKLED